MSLTERIADFAAAMADGLQVEDLCVGVGYTCVRLSDDSGGLSYTFRHDLGASCGVLQKAGSLTGMQAAEAIGWAGSRNLAAAAVGMATINAVLNRRFSAGPNIAEALDCQAEEVVGMVGYFCPLVWKFQKAKHLYIFERGRKAGSAGHAEILPEEEEAAFLPQCDIVVMTGTSFVNQTADAILSCCSRAREVIVVGASTPMCPEILRDAGVTVLAGTRVTNAAAAMRIAAQGGGGMDFFRASMKLLERI